MDMAAPKNSSYPFQRNLTTFDSTNPRPLLPLVEPPEYMLLYPPVLPLPPRSTPQSLKSESKSPSGAFSSRYALSTHIISAAFPRSTPYVPPLYDPSSSSEEINSNDRAAKEERKKKLGTVARKLLALKELAAYGEPVSEEDGDLFLPTDGSENRVLWNVVNRYVRKDVGDDNKLAQNTTHLTLFITHANGFPKEIWEPFLALLIESLANSQSSLVVDEIWCFESVQHGDACLINAGKLGSLYDWQDNSRDILNFLLHYLPSSVSARPLPTHLNRVSLAECASRQKEGFRNRTLIGIGHSFGGCTTALSALTIPKLFSSMVLVDPVILAPFLPFKDHLRSRATAGVLRREVWSSKEEAHRLFSQSPFFAAWDPAVLDIYIECGLYSPSETKPIPPNDTIQDGKELAPLKDELPKDKKHEVRLKMPGYQEAVVFCERRVGHEVFEMLPKLDERIPIRWIVAGKDANTTGGEAATRELVWRRPKNASNIRIAKSGHLIAHEAPDELAREVFEFLKRTYTPSFLDRVKAKF